MKHPWITAGYAVDGSLPAIAAAEADARKLTHLNVAFGLIADGAISLGHLKHLACLPALKSRNPSLSVVLSVGGWGAGGFSEAAANARGRQRFAESAVQALRGHPFDGIDIDWEYPCYSAAGIASSREDKTNFTLLLKELREALDVEGAANGRHYSLTIAAGADRYFIDGTEMAEVQRYLDFVMLMTYDMRGGFQTFTGHHANLFTPSGDLFRISADASARLFAEAGVPKDKIVIGAAFYSRMWTDVPNRDNGLHQMTAGSGGYGPDYARLSAEYIGKNGYVRHWDDEAKAPYLFDGQRFITYEDEQSLRCKCEYVNAEGLAGLMFWEYGCDATGRLLGAIDAAFGDLAGGRRRVR